MQNRVQLSLAGAGLLPYGLQDIEQVRLLLYGDSVVDWRQLAFRDLTHVDEALVTMGIRPWEPDDIARLERIHSEAVEYMDACGERDLGMAVRRPDDVRKVFLFASRPGPEQVDACMVLKVMHIIHHAAGRQLLYRLPAPINELFFRIERKVYDAVDQMKALGVAITEFGGSRKRSDAIITKLLCRRDSQAAQIHDRLRFRLVTETLDGLLAALVYMGRELIPFNYVVPGESRNDLLDLEQTLEENSQLNSLVGLLQVIKDSDEPASRFNRFSDGAYRDVNFVVDMAVRVEDLVSKVPGYEPAKHGKVVFLLVEFQLADRATHRRNNQGKSRHSLYKARQRRRAFERLISDMPSLELEE